MFLKNKPLVLSVTFFALVLGAGAAFYLNPSQLDGLALFQSNVDHKKRKHSEQLSDAFAGQHDRHSQTEVEFISDIRFMAEWDEQDFKKIEKEILSPLLKSIKTKNLSTLAFHTPELFSIQGLPVQTNLLERKRVVDGIEEYVWMSRPNPVLGFSDSKRSFQNYLSQFSEISDADFVATEVLSSIEERGEYMEMNSAEIRIRFDLRGLTSTNERRHDRGEMIAKVSRLIGDKWSLEGLNFVNGETLMKKTPTFVDATEQLGLKNIQSYLRKEAIRRGGYALSLSDINNDGNVDIFVGAMGNSQLLVGNGQGSFQNMPTDLDHETLVKSAVFADFNNSGKQDLLVVRFEPSKFLEGQSNEEVIIYENKGEGKFVKNHQAFKNSIDTSSYDHAMPAAVADFNNNGLLDIYVGFPGNKDFTFFSSRDLSLRSDKRVQGLYLNQGDGSYKDILAEGGGGDFQVFNDSRGSVVFPHSALAADFNRNGHMDILVIDDVGNLSPMYRNRGDGGFDQSAKAIGLSNSQFGMSTSLGDYNNNGMFDVLMTNVNFHSIERMQKSTKLNYGMPYTQMGTNGLRLFQAEKFNGDVIYTDVTERSGLDFTGEGLAGVEFIDYNNNGLLDIYVVNGLWSGTNSDKTQDISSWYARAGSNMVRLLKSIAYEDDQTSQTSSFLMRILQNFKGDVLNTKQQMESGDRPSLAGFQRNRLFRNNGDGTYTEVGFLEGVDSIADGYIVGLGDLNNDGRMDMVLRNGDPGSTEVEFAPVQVYLNNSPNKMKSTTLALEGTRGNKDAIGTIVEADVAGKTLTRQLVANNGTAQSQRLIHLGLAENDKIDELRIYWPLGKVQTLKNIPAGHHKIIEPIDSPVNASAMK